MLWGLKCNCSLEEFATSPNHILLYITCNLEEFATSVNRIFYSEHIATYIEKNVAIDQVTICIQRFFLLGTEGGG